MGKMKACKICPFECSVDREKKFGVCGLPNKILLSHYQQHFFEEPMISGEGGEDHFGGSGAIFFTGCNARCVFCQNYKISQKEFYKNKPLPEISEKKLLKFCEELIAKKVHNINLVSPTPYSLLLRDFLKKYKSKIKLPIIWNSNGYEKTSTLKKLEGLVDVYLPDLKYFDDKISQKYSSLKNYFKYASSAIIEMHRQVGFPKIARDGFIKKGLIIRHLVLPGHLDDSKKILQWIHETFGKKAYVALMSQYYPTHRAKDFPEIARKLTKKEHDEICNFFINLGFEDGLFQDLSSAEECYTPVF